MTPMLENRAEMTATMEFERFDASTHGYEPCVAFSGPAKAILSNVHGRKHKVYAMDRMDKPALDVLWTLMFHSPCLTPETIKRWFHHTQAELDTALCNFNALYGPENRMSIVQGVFHIELEEEWYLEFERLNDGARVA